MPLLVKGMQGLGDNIHQRALLRPLIEREQVVWLETPWPSVYHDYWGNAGLRLLKGGSLRTQAKNAAREAKRYTTLRPPATIRTQRIWYSHSEIRATGSFLAAMGANAHLPVSINALRLPIPEEWKQAARAMRARLGATGRRLMLYRPLVERTEWRGCSARNPDPEAYYEIAHAIRSHFFVLSVADLAPGVEWIVGRKIEADYEAHRGEIEFPILAALAAEASLVFASPGFAVPLAQSVRAPLILVSGGHESGRFYNHGLPENLFIDPIAPCDCFNNQHCCDKRIDIPRAVARALAFVVREELSCA